MNKTKYFVNQIVWTTDIAHKPQTGNRRPNVLCGRVSGIEITSEGRVLYKLSCSDHRSYRYDERCCHETAAEAIADAENYRVQNSGL